LKETTPEMSQYRRKLGGAEQETSLSVFATWELSYQQLLTMDTDDKCIADLLTLTAFFAEGGVSESLLKAYRNNAEMFESQSGSPESSKTAHDNKESYGIQRVSDKNKHSVPSAFLFQQKEKWDSDLYIDALATIAQLSLVEGFSKASDGTYKVSLHPLIRDWIRLRTDKTACAEYTYLAATCIHKLLKLDKRNSRFTLGFSVR
jgi:hypothetical protein